ncbi:helix-turn-helix domain-containing protein [Sphingobium abikonense]|uniref:helix-turn-helix domain-containing protein n=1 Tax=Sphingobium abikonense TaxID=86193 RepID=UPI0009FEBFC0|nr:LysR family transcriptional regulator [Sphingobium abikonense]
MKMMESANQARVIRQFTARWLVSFLTVIERQNLTAAASHLRVHRSNVSRDIDALEHWLGRVLFRDNVTFELTEDGKRFQETAQTMTSMLIHSRSGLPLS